MSALFRFIKIGYVVIKYRLIELLPEPHLPFPIKWLAALSRLFGYSRLSEGQRLRLALESLGPVYVKFGQILSTRRDIIPLEIADEIKHLQDNVQPFSGELAETLVEKSLGKNITMLFQSFDKNPLASASIAQVHTATLPSGESVVIKIIRPNILSIIKKDIKILYKISQFIEKVWSDGKRLRPTAVVKEFEKTILNELDLLREAANTSQLRRNFQEKDVGLNEGGIFRLLYVPKVYWDYSRHDILVMERISGISATDVSTLKQHDIDLKKLAERGVEIFFTQVFKHNFFHADMHPGNIFVSPKHPQNPQYIAVDCGIIGSLTPEDQNYIARNLLAFFQRDYHLVAQLHIECGWVSYDTPINEFEADIRCICEPIFERPLKDISLGLLLIRLFQISRRYKMEVQPQLILLQKTLLNIEGMGREIYPDLDLWSTAKPFLEDWMKQRLHPRELLKNFQQHTPAWLDQFPQLPQIALGAIQKINNIENQAKTQQKTLELLLNQIVKKPKTHWRYFVGASFVTIALLIYFLSNQAFNPKIPDPELTQQLIKNLATLLLAALGLSFFKS